MELAVTVPGLLRDSAGGQTDFTVAGATLAEALQSLRATYPMLHSHLYEETGRLRPHVLIFYNARSIARLPSLDIPLAPGDHLDIVQAVSGG